MDFRGPQHRRSVDRPDVFSAYKYQRLRFQAPVRSSTSLRSSLARRAARSSSRTTRPLPLPPLPPLGRVGGALECCRPGIDTGLDTGLDSGLHMGLDTGGDELEVGGAELEMGGYGFDTDG